MERLGAKDVNSLCEFQNNPQPDIAVRCSPTTDRAANGPFWLRRFQGCKFLP